MQFALPYVSHSQLSQYEHCPRCYFLKYHLKIKAKEDSEALRFGSAYHNAVDAYHKFGVIPNNIDRLVRKAVEVYAQRFPSNYLDATEKRYDIIMRNPDTGEPLPLPVRLIMDGYRLRGSKRIAEHKTAGATWTWEKVHTEKQATLYSYAFRLINGVAEDAIDYDIMIKPKVGTNFRLQVMTTHRDQSDYANFWYWAKGIMDKMDKGQYERGRHSGFACDACRVCV